MRKVHQMSYLPEGRDAHLHLIHIVTGATASGKSARVLELAQRRGGIIINADSMQLYREAPILTAQPNPEERESVPHLLYSVLAADDPASVARWLEMAITEIRLAWERGQLPVVTGGTGMYLAALMRGIAPVPDISPHIREEVRSMDAAALHSALSLEDAPMAARLNAGDTQRLARALEVVRATGRSLSDWQQSTTQPPLPEAHITLEIISQPTDVLAERIHARLDAMLESGGLEEVRALASSGVSRDVPLMRSVGIAQLLEWCDGKSTLEQATQDAKTATRRYAKRQRTWMRHQFAPHTLPPWVECVAAP